MSGKTRRRKGLVKNSAYNKEGVDVSVIRWFLKKTPAERLRDVQNAARFVLKVRARAANN